MRTAAIVVVLVVTTRVVAAPPALTPAEIETEKSFRADIAKLSVDAAIAWDEGNTARDANRPSDAEAAYRKAIAVAPNVDHLHRRLCWAVAAQGRLEDAIHECELALSLSPSSAYDKSALAAALLSRHTGGDQRRAAQLADEAVIALPADVATAQIDCQARAAIKDFDGLKQCGDHLLSVAPDDPLGNYIAAGVAVDKGNFARARIALERAKAHGLRQDVYDDLRSQIEKARERSEPLEIDDDRALDIGVPVILGWLALLAVLLMIGNGLSAVTLRGADHAVDADPTPRERRLRHVYRIVLLLTAILFYVSLPLMLIVVLAAAYIAFAMFDAMGGTPIIAIVLIIGVVGSTFLAVVRALFPGRELPIEGALVDPATSPQLRSMLDEVAATVGTRPVDAVYLVPGTDMAVTERRGLLRSLLNTRSQRVLLMGVALFDGMKQRELRAVLAHEYGHFRNDDVGVRALSVQRSLIRLIVRMSGTRAATRFNPAWWFLRAYTHLYLVVSRGASRLKEVLADRWAIRAYGSDAFVAGYRHAVTREVEFNRDLTKTLKDVIANKWSLPNLYAYDVEHDRPREELDAEIAKAMNHEPGRFDTHPSPRQRIQWAERLALPAERTRPHDDEPVWSLFSNPEQIERDMTAVIRERVRQKMGVTIGDAEWDDD